MSDHDISTMPNSWPKMKERKNAVPGKNTGAAPGIAYARAWAKTNGEVAIGIGDQTIGNVVVVTSLTREAAAGLYEQLGKALAGKASKQ